MADDQPIGPETNNNIFSNWLSCLHTQGKTKNHTIYNHPVRHDMKGSSYYINSEGNRTYLENNSKIIHKKGRYYINSRGYRVYLS
jgi:hypothetical protein